MAQVDPILGKIEYGYVFGGKEKALFSWIKSIIFMLIMIVLNKVEKNITLDKNCYVKFLNIINLW